VKEETLKLAEQIKKQEV